MSLSGRERSVLEWYRASRAEPPTFAALVVRHLPRLFAFAVGIAAVCALEWGRDREAAMLAIGIFIGVVVERLMRFREVP